MNTAGRLIGYGALFSVPGNPVRNRRSIAGLIRVGLRLRRRWRLRRWPRACRPTFDVLPGPGVFGSTEDAAEIAEAASDNDQRGQRLHLTDGWTDAQMHGRMDGRADRQADERMVVVCSRWV
jgi:hypothetical protein